VRDQGSLNTSEREATVRPFPPIADLAAIGDGRTVALVGRDGTIGWMPVPYVDSPAVFGSLLDRSVGGSFRLAPTEAYTTRRRYLPGTNVLETIFDTDGGAARVTDALTLPLGEGLTPFLELVRRIEGLQGRVGFEWTVEPRFGYGYGAPRLGWRYGIPVAAAGSDAVAISSWGAGSPRIDAGTIRGSFGSESGTATTIALNFAHGEPLVFSTRSDAERRLDLTIGWWRRWSSSLQIETSWREPVLRSALALKILVQARTGAIAAAPTTSLPETLGGERNFDYRFGWVRDSALVLNALLSLGCHEESEAYFWWLMHASQRTHPRLQVLYRLDGGAKASERTLGLEGYCGSRPVRIGNQATEQRQLDIYGDVVDGAWRYAESGHRIDPEFAERVAEMADLVCELWTEPDSGIWEVRSEPLHFTHSKMMCWVALDRSLRLGESGHIPSHHADSWRRQKAEIERFIEERCWSERRQSYVRSAGSEDLDASLLLGIVLGYEGPSTERITRTVDAIRSDLGRGPLLFRYRSPDGLEGEEGAFLCCSFWLVEALARIGRRDEARALMRELLDFANDVGLYSEEIRPTGSEFLGNFPQALTHLSLINAASALSREAAA